MVQLEDSILNTIKKLMGIDPEYDVFDPDIITHINTVLGTLGQLGLHDVEGFEIEGPEETWAQLLSNRKLLNPVKSYVYLKVRLLHDPPTSSFAIESFAKQASELEWRINIQLESVPDPTPLGL